MNRDGGGLTRLTEMPDIDATEPLWSPRGGDIAFTVFRDSSYLIKANRSFKEQVPEEIGPRMGSAGQMFDVDAWSPDGRKLAGVIWSDQSDQTEGIAVYSLESDELERLTDFGNGPCWLPDNRRVAFHHEGRLFLADSKSKAVSDLAFYQGSQLYNAKFSPDGREMFFVRSITEADIWMMTLRGE